MSAQAAKVSAGLSAADQALVNKAAAYLQGLGGRLLRQALGTQQLWEPPPDHLLLRNPRVMITPHSAWYSEDASGLGIMATMAHGGSGDWWP